ncbi:MAG: mycothione reductase [Ilumatobacteraceae bacterium]
MEHYDLVILGAGSGNSIITPDVDEWKVAMVEEWVFGGTCLNRGCIPTKMFVHAADTVLHAEHAARLGVDAHVDGVRWLDIRDRVFGRIDPIAAGGERYRTYECPNVTVHAGRGRFIGERQLEVITPEGPVQIEGRQVVVAAGARPMIPDIPGLVDTGFHTSDDIMRVDAVPEHLIVLGGGFIACELAHVFGSFGSRITIVQRGSRLLRSADDDISRSITDHFGQRFELVCNATVSRVSRQGDTVQVHLADGSIIEGSDILVATGRTPNSDVIDAAAGGLAVLPDGRIHADATGATSVPGVWALGDISSPYMLKHVANHEARVVAHNVAHPDDLRSTDYQAVPHAVFTNPQIASVGITEREALEQGLDVMVATQRYSDVAYGWALEDTESFCKLIADRSRRVLIGAHIIGPQSSSLIQQLIHGIRYETSIDDMARGQYYIHPALGEVVENALLQFPRA